MRVVSDACTGVAIGVKSADGRATNDQGAWLDAFLAGGSYTSVCRSADEARDAVQLYLDVELPPL